MDILQEVPSSKQKQPEAGRRWFHAAGADLYVWHDAHNTLTALRYQCQSDQEQYLLTWNTQEGIRQQCNRLDATQSKNVDFDKTQILNGRAAFDEGYVARDFRVRGLHLEPPLYQFILYKLFDPLQAA
ncbi:MAG: hypothetical protein H0W44_04205 [Gammaproteobacteria bacterium]|nr:hypothetical protein [Gammaproteobacteria bacterium]